MGYLLTEDGGRIILEDDSGFLLLEEVDDGFVVSVACIPVELNGWLFDGTTQDADGVCYSWNSIDGWFDTPDL